MARLIRYPAATRPRLYALENQLADPDGVIDAAIFERVDFKDKVVLDVGAGGGVHSERYAPLARHVVALEPDPDMLRLLHQRLGQSEAAGNVSVLAAGAEEIPLPDNTVAVAHARFAYFFGGPSCLPGLAEVRRVLSPGGHLFVVDNDVRWGQFGALCRRSYPKWASEERVQAQRDFYREQGFTTVTLQSCWRAPDRDTLAEVLAFQFSSDDPSSLLDGIDGVEMSYGVALHHLQV